MADRYLGQEIEELGDEVVKRTIKCRRFVVQRCAVNKRFDGDHEEPFVVVELEKREHLYIRVDDARRDDDGAEQKVN